MVKRCFDVVFSAALLLISLPVLVLSALIIRITSPGPVFFRQVRMGRGFQTFEILKFRTMMHNEAGLAYTLGADPRITAVGKLLRRTKLDEMPQLWNILRGQMSLVGPRPVIPELTYEFEAEYSRLLQYRPGLTDPASLKYSQEARIIGLVQAEDQMPLFKKVITPDKLAISLEYVERATVWSDIKIMTMTGAICCFPSLSCFYGQLPDVMAELRKIELTNLARARKTLAELSVQLTAPIEASSSVVTATSNQAHDGCIFSHGLVEVEASEEEPPQVPYLPWIAFPNVVSDVQSSTRNVDGGGSRLQ